MAGPSITRNGKKIRLDYAQDGQRRTALWEPMRGGTVQTVFDADGAVIRQSLLPEKKGDDLDYHLVRFINENGLQGARESNEQFADVTLQRPCPTCGKTCLVREAGSVTEASKAAVMPMYLCESCKTRSYYLSDQYLEHLVDGNARLFSESEAKELSSNRSAALSELREYIIRIFASKKIARIR